MAAPDSFCLTDPEIPDGENNWFITGPELELIPEYSADIWYRWGASGEYTQSTGATPVSGMSLPAPSGDSLLYYFASGSASGSGPINICRVLFDDTVPSGTIIAPTPSAYISGDFMIEASGEDTLSGVYRYIFRSNGRFICELAAPSNIYYWDTALEEDGIKIVSLETVDEAGNSGTDSMYIYIDNSPPSLEIFPYPSLIMNSGADFYGKSVDYLCPIDRIDYKVKINDDTVPAWQSAVITSGSGTADVSWRIPLSGLVSGDLVTLWIRAWDTAGNVQTAENYLKVTLPVQYM